MTVIREAWSSIRKEGRSESGWHVRRVYTDAPCELFAGILQPGSVPGLLIEVSVNDVPAGGTLPKSKGFEIDPALLGGSTDGRVRFALKLSELAYEAVFSVLCDDTARAAGSEKRPRAAVRAWINRLHIWQEFMARHGVEGLSETAACGLLGELLVMRNMIIPAIGGAAAVQAWAGPLGEPNDFTLVRGYLEVKTTVRQAPELIEISDFGQLDDARGTIVLAHVKLRPSPTGESLPQVVSTLRSAVAGTSAKHLARFDQLLMSAGYIDAQADLYDSAFELSSVDFFHVTGAFPRIRRSDVVEGIRDLRYTIELASCETYLLEQQEAARLLQVEGNG